jgi:hypothetical protein
MQYSNNRLQYAGVVRVGFSQKRGFSISGTCCCNWRLLWNATVLHSSVLSATTPYWVDACSNSCTTSAGVKLSFHSSTGVVEVNANSGTVFGCYSTVKSF